MMSLSHFTQVCNNHTRFQPLFTQTCTIQNVAHTVVHVHDRKDCSHSHMMRWQYHSLLMSKDVVWFSQPWFRFDSTPLCPLGLYHFSCFSKVDSEIIKTCQICAFIQRLCSYSSVVRTHGDGSVCHSRRGEQQRQRHVSARVGYRFQLHMHATSPRNRPSCYRQLGRRCRTCLLQSWVLSIFLRFNLIQTYALS